VLDEMAGERTDSNAPDRGGRDGRNDPASWLVATDYGRSVDAPRISASDLEVAKLESVILLLIDQRRWAAGALPMIPW
jgi:hypothetical protein